jgi:hypothetical protein
MWSSQCFYTPLHSNRPEVLSGLSKQGPVFRNSYVIGHLCHVPCTGPHFWGLGGKFSKCLEHRYQRWKSICYVISTRTRALCTYRNDDRSMRRRPGPPFSRVGDSFWGGVPVPPRQFGAALIYTNVCLLSALAVRSWRLLCQD